MTEAELELFNDSLTRCTSNPLFLERFYDLFLSSSEAVKEKFKHTDFKKQRRMLQASFYMLMLAAGGKPETRGHLERLAEIHGQNGHDIPPQMYQTWLDCLIQAVKESDPRFTPETETVWRQMMTRGIEFMIDHRQSNPH
jgi:hemoglobin-like flavoprotein